MNRRLATLVPLGIVAGAATALGFYWPFSGHRDALVLPGTVQTQEVRLGSKLGGRVAEVFVREGDAVAAGAPLVRLDDAEVVAQRDQVRARLAAAEAELQKAQYSPRPAEVREAVAQTKVAEARLRRARAGSREQELRVAVQEVRAAEAEAVETREAFDRAVRARVATSEAEFQAAKAAFERAAARRLAAAARHDLLRAGTHEDDVAEAEADRDRWKAREDLLREGVRAEDVARAAANVEQLRAKLRETEALVTETVVRAADAGVVEVVAVRPGDLLPPNQPAVRLLRRDDLWVRAFVPETDLGHVRLNRDVELTVDSHPGRRFAGRVVQIAGESEFTPRNVQTAEDRRHQVFAVKVAVADPDGVVKAGMAAEVTIPRPGEQP